MIARLLQGAYLWVKSWARLISNSMPPPSTLSVLSWARQLTPGTPSRLVDKYCSIGHGVERIYWQMDRTFLRNKVPIGRVTDSA
ncbi:hypothetical protein F5X98DRAFT_354006 [Xylaria grammica]|nr:hypothetical protein F5X98DRAFT_354006 [Xylaria grammica]